MRTLLRTQLLAFACLAQLAAQTSQPAARIASWPKLDGKQQARVEKVFENMARPDEALRTAAEQELAAFGAGAAPLCLQRLSDFPTNINPGLYRVLDQITVAEHAPLLTSWAKDKRRAIRFWVVERLARFHDRGSEPILRAATKEKDPEIAFRAALGLVALGDVAALDAVFARCEEQWAEYGPLTLEIVAPGRSQGLADAVFARGEKGEARTRITALRLLRALGTPSLTSKLKPLLDSEDHTIKKETINALRVIVDRQPPLEELSVFQEIEMAAEWKKRI